MDCDQELSARAQSDLARGYLRRGQPSRRHRQRRLLHQRRRISDADSQRPAAAGFDILQSTTEVTTYVPRVNAMKLSDAGSITEAPDREHLVRLCTRSRA